MGLLYNVSAFMRPGQPLKVKVKDNRDKDWPVMIQLGPGGEDTIDIYANIENATRLRDALTAALSQSPYDGPLYDANPACTHNIVDAPGGGTKCTNCPGWYCV